MNNFEPRLLYSDQSSLYGSPIPAFDTDEAATNVAEQKFTDVIVLIEDEAGQALAEAYKAKGINALHFPIEDYKTPSSKELKDWVPQIVKLVQTPGHKILIHCMGGQGRTGLISACVLAVLKNKSGDDAIRAIRKKIPHAVETSGQEVCVRKFAEKFFI